MSDDQRNPDNTDASTPSDRDKSPEGAPENLEQAFFEAGGESASDEAAAGEPAEPQAPLPEASLEEDVEITTEEPDEASAEAAASGEAEAQPTTPPPQVRLSPDAASEALPLPGGPGSHPAPFDPRQAPAWQALLAEYEQEIAAIGDVPAAAILYYESGKIWEEKLAQPEKAWSFYKKAFQLQPKLTPNIRAAERLASQVGNWHLAIQILDSEAEAIDDAQVKAYLNLRRGQILEEKLGKAEEARAAYETAVRLASDNVEILKQFERLCISTGDWKTVLEVRAKLLEHIQDNAVRVQLLLASAKIYTVYFQNDKEAEVQYRRVLDLEPGNMAALAALRSLYSARKRHEELLEILQKEAGVTADPTIAAWLHYQAARLLREQMGDDDKALGALQRALALTPGNHMVLAEMAHIHENLMRWQELVDVYQQQVQVITDRQELVSLYFKLGNIWEEKLFNEDKAIENYRQVVELNPNYLPALQALGKLFYRKGQWDDLVQMYEIEIRETHDPRQKAVKLYKLAEILEERLSRDEDAIQRFEQCLELTPGYLPALKALGRLYSKYNRFESLIGMYENELNVSADMDQSVFLLDKIGTLWEEKLNNIDKAVETYQRLLEISPNYLPAIRTLGKLYVRADRWEDMIRVNDLEAQLVNDQKQVVSLLHRNGEIYEEKLNDKDQAIETYKKVLALAPSYLPALQSLGRLYFIKGRWEDLIAMHRQEIEVTQNEDQQINLLYKIGELYEEKLVQEDKAIVAFQEVLRIRPTNFPAMKALIRIFTNKRDWENLIEIYEKEAAVLEDPQQKALSLFQVAEIFESHLEDPGRAVETLQKILQIVSNHAPALRSLERLYTRSESWRELLDVYERGLENATHETQQVDILFRMAEVFASRVNDLVRASECHEKILNIKPDHLPSIEALERIYLSQRNYNALVHVYESFAARTQDQSLLLSLQSQIADLKENRLQPPKSAGENHLKVLSLNPQHPEAIRSLDILYHKFGTWKGLRMLYEQELSRVGSEEEALDLCLRVADLAETRLESLEVAKHYYQEALRLSPDFLPAIKALKRISVAQNDHEAMIGLLDREGQVSRDPRQSISTLLQAAQIYRDRFDQPDRAVECLFRVLEKDPSEVQAFSQLEALLIHQTDWERLAVLYRNRIGITEDNRILAELHLKLGGLLHERLQRPQDAAESYRKVLEINPSHQQALNVLAALAFDSEEWDQAVQLSSRLLELTNDPKDQAACHFRLGVVFQEKKPDLEKAVVHFKKVLEQTPSDIPTLQRLKAIHIARQQWNDAIEVLNQLIEADREPANQIQHQPDQAVAAYQRVQEMDPNNVTVIQKLGDLYEKLERWQELIDSYHAFIRLLPPERSHEAIPLHMKMGSMYVENLNNTDKAIIEYKHVAEISPRHAEAHEALAKLYGKTGLYYANAVDEHRKLLEINPFRVDSYHELRRIFEEQRAFDKVLCVCAVLHCLRAADQNEEFFYGENRGKVPERSTEQLSAEEVEALLVHPEERTLIRHILKLVGPHLSKVYAPNLERHGVGKGDRARPDDPLRTLCDGMAANLGEVEYELYHSNQPTHLVSVENGAPPAMIVGEGLIKRTVVKEQRFALGRAIKRIFDGSHLGRLLGPKELSKLVAAAVFPYHPSSPVATYPGESLDDLAKRANKALPRKVRKSMEELMRDQAPEVAKVPDYDAYLRGADHSANRMGLCMCNDLPQALMHLQREVPELKEKRFNTTEEIVAALSRHASFCELLRFAVSEEYFRLRARMKFSITA
jgi:tetratricopeptide (TPR) repeat protein